MNSATIPEGTTADDSDGSNTDSPSLQEGGGIQMNSTKSNKQRLKDGHITIGFGFRMDVFERRDSPPLWESA